VTTRQPSDPRAHRDPALDGLRGIAVMLVFFFHYGGGLKSPHLAVRLFGYFSSSGWIGVVVFFTLSGFLITGSLWDSRGSQHWRRNFYIRRLLRIFPLYYTALALSALGLIVAWRNVHLVWPFAIYVFFLQNLPRLEDLVQSIPTPLSLYHLWSMAVEEQFYLLWPLLLLTVRSRRGAFWLCLWTFAVSAAFRIAIYGLPLVSGQVAYSFRDFLLVHAGAFALGAYLAIAWRGPEKALIERLAMPAFFIGLALYLFSSLSSHSFMLISNLQFVVGLPGFSLAAAAVIALLLRNGVPRRLCSIAPLRFIGRISYGFYVFHILLQPTYSAITRHLTHSTSDQRYLITKLVLAFSATLLISWISFHLLELPFLRLKRHFPMKPPVAVE
jgi:peptidoglycan/LPS O-acetylase OafA/YrhL